MGDVRLIQGLKIERPTGLAVRFNGAGDRCREVGYPDRLSAHGARALPHFLCRWRLGALSPRHQRHVIEDIDKWADVIEFSGAKVE